MKRISPVLALLLLCSCTTTQLEQTALAAKPLADLAITVAAAHYGVPPTDTRAAIAAFDSLWGAYAQAQAKAGTTASVAPGASIPSVGAAIQHALPPGPITPQTIALLQAAAQAVPAPAH